MFRFLEHSFFLKSKTKTKESKTTKQNNKNHQQANKKKPTAYSLAIPQKWSLCMSLSGLVCNTQNAQSINATAELLHKYHADNLCMHSKSIPILVYQNWNFPSFLRCKIWPFVRPIYR